MNGQFGSLKFHNQYIGNRSFSKKVSKNVFASAFFHFSEMSEGLCRRVLEFYRGVYRGGKGPKILN